MRFLILIFLFFLTTQSSLIPQEYFIPLNIRQAYDKGTRSPDGTPGPNYWQNSAQYKIRATLEPESRRVRGEEHILFTNHSPDTLTEIVVRLYQNLYKYGAKRNFTIHPDAVYDGVFIHAADIEGDRYIENNKYNGAEVRFTSTNVIFSLRRPMMPGSSIELFFRWNFIIPALTNIRMGTYDPTTFFVGYWYPQVAVYDDIDGWDLFDYNGEQEFYNNYSDFEVDITVPNSFAVWATGVFENPEQVLEKEFYNRYKQSLITDSVIKIISVDDDGAVKFNNSKPTNTWRFTAENVTDFAFSLSDHYLWDASSMQFSNHRSYIATAYDRDSKDFHELLPITRDILDYLSNEMPGVEYPYPSLTIFNGAGGMEYPMIINNASMSTISGAAGLAAHEAAHMYFPFYVGINERKYAFMDEGWAVMLPRGIQNKYGSYPINDHVLLYEKLAGTELDVPPMVPSTQIRGTTYRNSAYFRPGLAYHFLADYMDSLAFENSLHKYIADWNGKHPTPYDFFFSFNNSAGEDLIWFWNPWFFDYNYPDLAIKEVESGDSEARVIISRKGNIPVPVLLTFENADGTLTQIKRNAGVWKNGAEEVEIIEKISSRILRITLNLEDIPDIDRSDNIFTP
jgi:hypothetical protein